jgi:hypothetical protein
MILTAVKMKFVDTAIESLPERTCGRERITIKRHVAHHFNDSGKIDHTGEFTIFGQTFQTLSTKTPKWEAFKLKDIDEQVFQAEFDNEDSIDIGGPYREIMTNIGNELELGGVLPLLVKSTN